MSEDVAAVEAALASLSPAPSTVDRERMMYLAGRASAAVGSPRRPARTGRLWPLATAASTLLAVTFGALLLVRGSPPVETRVVYVEAPPADGHAVPRQPTGPASPGDRLRKGPISTDYLRMRRLVLSKGIDALPAPKARRGTGIEAPWRARDYHQQLRELLEDAMKPRPQAGSDSQSPSQSLAAAPIPPPGERAGLCEVSTTPEQRGGPS